MATEEEVHEGVEAVNMLSQEFDVRTQERHIMGAEKYGPVKFFDVDTLEMAIDEVLDLGNYARYTYIKLRIVQQYLANLLSEVEAPVDFVPSSEFTKPKE